MSKVVYVSYAVSEIFRIPKNLDLENKEQVKFWGVKYNTLHIVLADDEELEIEPEGLLENCDYKYPKNTSIENGADWGIEEEEEEEEICNDPQHYDVTEDRKGLVYPSVMNGNWGKEVVIEEEYQDDFTERICENDNCRKEFHTYEPHYYDEEEEVCYCCKECKN
jgi:hypothetical protein